MNITDTKRSKLFQCLDPFRNGFRRYLIARLQSKYGNACPDEFLAGLSPNQRENFERDLRNNSGKTSEDLIDFAHFRPTALRFKDLFRDDFGNEVNDLPTWLAAIAKIRNNVAHGHDIARDDAELARIHMDKISGIIGPKGFKTTRSRRARTGTFKSNAIRVYDLAKELKQDAKSIIKYLQQEGADVTLPSNSVSGELAEKARMKYLPQNPT